MTGLHLVLLEFEVVHLRQVRNIIHRTGVISLSTALQIESQLDVVWTRHSEVSQKAQALSALLVE